MIWLILILAFFLRVLYINQSLWLDEAINVLSAKNLDFISFVIKYPIGDFHPPGYFILLWIWTHIFGFGEIAVRTPSVILGVLTVGLVYFLGKELWNKNIGLLAAALMAVAPLHIYYSQEARMYSLSAFSVTLSFYFFVRLISNKSYSFLGYAIAVVLVLYSDYVAYLVLPAQLIFLILSKNKYLKNFFLAWATSFLLYLPWMVVFPQQLLIGKTAADNLSGWKDVVGGTGIKNLALVWIKILIGRISFTNREVYTGVVGFLSIFFGWLILTGIKGKVETSHKLLILWLIVPLILAWLISFFIPVLAYFRLLFILPPFYLLVAYGISKVAGIKSRITFVVALSASLIFISFYYFNPQFQREDWRGAVFFIKSTIGQNDIVLFENNHVPYPFVYYADKLPQAEKGLNNIPAKKLTDIVDTELLKNKTRIYVFEYLVEITDPERLLEKKVTSLDYQKDSAYNFFGVGLVNVYVSK